MLGHNPLTTLHMASPEDPRRPPSWVAVKELKSSYHKKEALYMLHYIPILR